MLGNIIGYLKDYADDLEGQRKLVKLADIKPPNSDYCLPSTDLAIEWIIDYIIKDIRERACKLMEADRYNLP